MSGVVAAFVACLVVTLGVRPAAAQDEVPAPPDEDTAPEDAGEAGAEDDSAEADDDSAEADDDSMFFDAPPDADYVDTEEGPIFIGRVVAEPPTPAEPEPEPEARRWADRRYWSRADSRWFMAGAVDLGALYFRPRFSAGYGKPHSTWVGGDLNPLFTGEGVGAYGGFRAALPAIDLRVGARYFFTFRRSFLAPQDEYDHLEVTNRSGPPSRYLSLETQLTSGIPVGFGAIFGELTGTAVMLVDDGFYVFEEQVRVIIDPPWIWSVRAGYQFPIGPERVGGLRFVGQVIGNPGRGGYTVRAGVEAIWLLWDDFELRGRVVPPISSSDDLGAKGGDSYQLGFRYRFATGD